MTLHFYFARQFISILVRTLLIAITLVFVVAALENTRRSGDSMSVLTSALTNASLKTPQIVVEAMPIVIVVAAIWFCGRMATTNQFVASRAAGISALRILLIPVACTFLTGMLGLILLNPAVASLSRQQEVFRAGLQDPSPDFVSVQASGLWLRQGRDTGHSVLHARGANGRDGALTDVTMVEFDTNGDAVRTTHAEYALLGLNNGFWTFFNAKSWSLDRETENTERGATENLVLTIPTTLTREQLLAGYPKAETIPFLAIPEVIRSMDEAGFSSRNYRIHYQTELARPLLFVANFLFGAAFILHSTRFGNFGRSAFLAILAGFTTHSLQSLVRSLGIAGDLPIPIAAWSVPVAATLFGISVILFQEDG